MQTIAAGTAGFVAWAEAGFGAAPASDTHYPWLPDEYDVIAGEKLPIRNGRMAIPAGPGLGVALDPDKLARAHEVYVKCGMKNRDDVATIKLVEPNWDKSLW